MSYNAADYVNIIEDRIEGKKQLVKAATGAVAKFLDAGDTFGAVDRVRTAKKVAEDILSMEAVLGIMSTNAEDADLTLRVLNRAHENDAIRTHHIVDATEYVFLNK